VKGILSSNLLLSTRKNAINFFQKYWFHVFTQNILQGKDFKKLSTLGDKSLRQYIIFQISALSQIKKMKYKQTKKPPNNNPKNSNTHSTQNQ
ncbi:unnamed protein product, partial [Coccothraustes coccothraustes]